MKPNKPNLRILVLCEGETEYFYAKALQMELPRDLQRVISIEIDYNAKNDPRNLAKEAKKRKEKARKEGNPFDKVWLFFDNDNWPQLKEAFEIIHREGFQIAYSSICIEHWFILHFENCGRAFQNGDEALSYIKRLWPEYHKTRIKHYSFLKDKLNEAISRAAVLRNNSSPDRLLHEKNPYFTIDKLIEYFAELRNH
ncbi:MAG: RloB domain-containing protein [Bacteroidetes bacterium]|nr:RloB domain-containing protein [Bacteroidota bacterium]